MPSPPEEARERWIEKVTFKMVWKEFTRQTKLKGNPGQRNKAMETQLENELVLPPKRISVWLWYWGNQKLMHSLGERLGSVQFHSVTQSCLTLQPHGLQHNSLPCPSPTPRACSGDTGILNQSSSTWDIVKHMNSRYFLIKFLAVWGIHCCVQVFSSCSVRASRCGALAPECRLSSPTACEIFPDQRSNLCPLLWQADS